MSNPMPQGDESAIYSPESMQRLMAHLWNIRHIPQAGSVLLYGALGGFAGLRPPEAVELDWKAIDFTERRLRVVSGAAKTERLIPIKENLSDFLLPYKNRKGLVIIHKKVATLYRDYCKEAGVQHIPNGLRRSYAMYRLAESTLEEVQIELGMNADMLKEKFPKPPALEAAQKYWAIIP
jgi:integrase